MSKPPNDLSAIDYETEQRFWQRVIKDPNGCWNWAGSTITAGYGSFSIDGKTYSAHRVAYALANGGVPDGAYVCHRCDNKLCCRPDHLYAGSHRSNMLDKKIRGRNVRLTGTDNGMTKISDGVARRIFLLYKSRRMSQQKIAKLFGLKRSMVADIVNRRTHKHVTKEL